MTKYKTEEVQNTSSWMDSNSHPREFSELNSYQYAIINRSSIKPFTVMHRRHYSGLEIDIKSLLWLLLLYLSSVRVGVYHMQYAVSQLHPYLAITLHPSMPRAIAHQCMPLPPKLEPSSFASPPRPTSTYARTPTTRIDV